MDECKPLGGGSYSGEGDGRGFHSSTSHLKFEPIFSAKTAQLPNVYPFKCSCEGDGRRFHSSTSHLNRPISVYRLGEMPIQSCGQSVSALRGKAGAMLNAHTELRAKRQRSAREAIYRNRPI